MQQNQTMKIVAAVLGIIAIALILKLVVFRSDPGAVDVKDLPASARINENTQRDPNAGPIPVDLSRQRGPATPNTGR